MADFLPGYEASTWYGIGAPKNTPAEIIDKLNSEINAVLADPKIKAAFADLGGTVLGGSPAAFGTLLATRLRKTTGRQWRPNIRLCRKSYRSSTSVAASGLVENYMGRSAPPV